ncbi:hypothetical protein SAMN05421666_1604 [Roseovarius nanhaiticus]|uniref:Uncharacterized protein n=1 Tax=Roseovarius nanhaiticus TaxID=573024 RepID=A0A1N7G2B5_9RHOB|nr:hypothetical protein SAMN05216208_0532 [Roseovarius nanhaiticus]SIS06743.1 hypothetical protein SAMN05421666_1604 [Roseovarius nanhaiticus]
MIAENARAGNDPAAAGNRPTSIHLRGDIFWPEWDAILTRERSFKESLPNVMHSDSSPMIQLLSRLRTALPRLGSGHCGRGARRFRAEAELDRLSRHIILPSVSVTEEETARSAYQDTGLKLARQEMWEELSTLIRQADTARTGTPGGESAAMLLAFGARSDVVSMAEDALHDGTVPDLSGVEALDALAEEMTGDYPVQAIVALMHADMAWAWSAVPGAPTLKGAAERRAHHAARASALLAPHCGAAEAAPMLASAECALLRIEGARTTAQRVAAQYQRLIDLDPASPRHMRAFGAALLAAAPGDYRQIEVEARRMAARTQAEWGAGAYTWTYLDALALDRNALMLLDPAFFIDGLRDILRLRPDQHTANLMAAFCAITMREAAPGGAPAAQAPLAACLTWILRDHLHELHPLIWTQALHRPGAGPLPPRRALISEGRRTALRAIAALFADDIAGGQSIAFSPAGMYMLPSL